MRITNSDVNVTECTFTNTSYGYRLINITGSNVKIDKSKFINISYSTYYPIINATRSNITISNSEFAKSSNYPILLNYSNANISGNEFHDFNSNYGINSDNSNSTICDNLFYNRVAYAPTINLQRSNSTLSGNTFRNLSSSYTGATYSPIASINGYANISDNDFIDTYSYYGGAIYISGPSNVIENNRFVNTSAVYGGAIYNMGYNLTLSGNTITDSNATYGKKIFNNYGSNSANINTVYLTLLNNETINSSSSIVDVDVLVTDDMGNEIFGKIVPVDLNDTRVGNVSITDGDVSIAVSNPGEGTYLVNGNYTGALNTIVKTGVITFLEPYTGPFYVATNGSDSNNGDVDHPFATIEQAIKAAAVSNNTHAIFINEGTYHEYDLSVPAGMNITGIGDVTIDADNKGRIMNVSGSNVNISNIKFSNGNFVSSSTSFAGALYWTGINGTLNNARFLNNNVVGNYSTASVVLFIGLEQMVL